MRHGCQIALDDHQRAREEQLHFGGLAKQPTIQDRGDEIAGSFALDRNRLGQHVVCAGQRRKRQRYIWKRREQLGHRRAPLARIYANQQ